jgi:hypothetical protein
MQRVFFAVDLVGLAEDLTSDPLIVTVACWKALACIFVPSIAITPTLTIPARAHSPSTLPNSSAIAFSWRWRNLAIVA